MQAYTLQRKERLKQRNECVRKLFESLSSKHPQWRAEAIIAEVATQMYLSPRTFAVQFCGFAIPLGQSFLIVIVP